MIDCFKKAINRKKVSENGNANKMKILLKKS